MNIYVGNLAYGVSEDDLRGLFEEFGEVQSVNIIKDRESGRSKGFGFVEMSDDEAGQKVIEEFNEKEIQGRNLRVNIAKPREDRGDRGGGRRY